MKKSQLASPCMFTLQYNKGLESTLFLFLPLTKLPHPNSASPEVQTATCISMASSSFISAVLDIYFKAPRLKK